MSTQQLTVEQKLTARGLVRGFRTVTRNDDGEALETFYFIGANGEVFKGLTQPYSIEFKSKQWQAVTALPAGVEFIGTYKQPKL